MGVFFAPPLTVIRCYVPLWDAALNALNLFKWKIYHPDNSKQQGRNQDFSQGGLIDTRGVEGP